MKHKWILTIIICIVVISSSTIFFYKGELNITGAVLVDLLAFNYSAVTEKEDFPKVNVTGVIDNICMFPNLPLWSKAGAGEAGGQIAVTVSGCPGTQMYVTEVQQVGNTTWFRIQKHEVRDGFQMYWDGWVSQKVILQGPLPVPLEEYKKSF